MKHSMVKNRIRQVSIIGFWILVWQIAYFGVGKEILIPSPFHTFQKLLEMIQEKAFYIQVVYTLYRVCMGVVISFVIGVIAALFSYFNKLIEEILQPLVRLFKSTPVMAVIILALLWVNSSDVPILVCFLMCFPIVYTNVLTGLSSVDRSLIEMTRVYKVKRRFIIKDIYIPHVSNYIKSALSLSVGLAWKVVIAAEVVAVPKFAMGYNLLTAKIYLETQEVFAWVIVIVILSSLCENLVNKLLEGRKKAWNDTGKRSL